MTDRSQYYIRELLDSNYQIFKVMLDEVKADFSTFYLIVISGIALLIIITIQIIATITRLPIGYLAYPCKYLVIKKSNYAHYHLIGIFALKVPENQYKIGFQTTKKR